MLFTGQTSGNEDGTQNTSHQKLHSFAGCFRHQCANPELPLNHRLLEGSCKKLKPANALIASRHTLTFSAQKLVVLHPGKNAPVPGA